MGLIHTVLIPGHLISAYESTLNERSALRHFRYGNTVEIRNGIMFNFYPRLPHMLFVKYSRYAEVGRLVGLDTFWFKRGGCWSSVLYNLLASFPGPAQLSVAYRQKSRKGAWYLFLREWHWDGKDGRKGLIVHGHTGSRTSKRAKVPGNLPHVSS